MFVSFSAEAKANSCCGRIQSSRLGKALKIIAKPPAATPFHHPAPGWEKTMTDVAALFALHLHVKRPPFCVFGTNGRPAD